MRNAETVNHAGTAGELGHAPQRLPQKLAFKEGAIRLTFRGDR
jgi:hypothetical protein